MKTILGEYRIHNADIVLRYDATAEDLIDVVEGNRVYIPCIYILNKIDQISVEVKFLGCTGCGYDSWPSLNSHCANSLAENMNSSPQCYG